MTPAEHFPWDDSRLIATASARHLQLGGRSALFCARRQQIFELNDAADAIWRAIALEGSPRAAARALSDAAGAEQARVFGYVRQAAREWISGGQLAPVEVIELIDGRPTAQFDLSLDELHLRARLFGDIDVEAFRAAFGQFAAAAPQLSGSTLSAAAAGGLVFLFEDGGMIGAYDRRRWIPEVKAWLTDRYAKGVEGAFLTHGALLSRRSGGLLLCGEPGAGKTTLTIALSRAGWDYQADDIVRIDPHGRAMGAPFAPAVKRGAWDLLRPRVPELAALPAHLRADGQEARYLPVAPTTGRAPLPLAGVLILARRAGSAAAIEPVEPLEALTTILGGAYSAKGAIDPQTLEALAAAVDAARCGRLVYEALDPAIAAVDRFAP